ncbi:MAG: Signal transduction histidine kinase [Deltaproteobacteria bacterium]|nr:Signal transduction histidine kinase [Deltaproteobacteria bacterium]
MKNPGRILPPHVEGLGGILLLIFTFALPVLYFLNGWGLQSEHLQTETEIYARQVSSLINRNPDMWKFEAIRLEGLLAKRPEDPHIESIRILDNEGHIVTERPQRIDWPQMTRSHPLMDSGLIVGSLEETASVRPLVVQTAVMTMAGAGIILLLLFLFRTYPLAALRNALDMLSREKGRSRVTLQSIGDGVISTDAKDRVVIVNRMAEKITGWTQAEAAGKPIGEVFPPDGDVFTDRKGGVRKVETDRSPVLDENGRHVGNVFVFRDVTEKVRVERAMANAQKLESLGVLAGGIAHEIRNPLSSINISISSIERACGASNGFEPEAKEKIDRILEQMKSAAAKMGLVVQRVLDYSKPFPPRKETVHINTVIEEAVRLSLSTLRKREITLLKDLDPDLAACRADAQMIEQVLVNLITNACQAMEGTEGAKYLEIASAARDGRIVLRVSDSGPGVPPSLREKVFDPFFTTRKDGSGIGLSFSHRIVTDNGGSLRVDTSRWGGAEFRIELPAEGGGVPA